MNQNIHSLINSHNSWGRLREVWLGDVYPQSWYDHLDSEVRDCFYELTERTQQDLLIIQRTLEQFDVVVRRPCYDNIDHYVAGPQQMLVKPSITPRDFCVTLGNTLYAKAPAQHDPWQGTINEYLAAGADVKERLVARSLLLNGANVIRCGRDLYIDLENSQSHKKTQQELIEIYQTAFADQLRDYRVHLIFNGGHLDGCFATLQPGLLLSSEYYNGYDDTFPNWDRINTRSPEFVDGCVKRPGHHPYHNNKWWLPGVSTSGAFNDHVIKHALDWVGDYTETYFDVNCLVLDEQNVMMLGEHETVFRELERRGITVHSVPFRTRTFWDGGLHCLTVDIRRDSTCEDYFPERGNSALTLIE